MTKFEEECARKGLVVRDIKNSIIANFWIFAWTISLIVISYISDFDWYSSTWVIVSGLIIHAGLGIGMILAFKRFVTQADDLERKIQLDALAISVGVTFVCFSSSRVLEKSAGIPELSATYVLVVMAVTYSAGIIIGRIRFR